jgi:hypothetical protein
MRPEGWLKVGSRYLLGLILLTANVAAPFRTSALGRALLEDLRQRAATSAVIRVRAHAPIGSSVGFRAVVGIARGGADGSHVRPTARRVWTVLSAPSGSPHPALRPLVVQPTPPLRC